MAHPTMPSSVQEAKGYFLAHPERKRGNEPTTDKPLGDPPKHLNEDETVIWHEVSAQLLPGVGKFSDRVAFETLVVLINRMRQKTLKATEMMSIVSLCGRFAMTPADRCKVSVEAPAKNALDSFINS